jgi:hypothetical protein
MKGLRYQGKPAEPLEDCSRVLKYLPDTMTQGVIMKVNEYYARGSHRGDVA